MVQLANAGNASAYALIKDAIKAENPKLSDAEVEKIIKASAKAKSSPQCIKEWEEATEECEKLIEKGGYRGITGNYNDVFQCAKGLVSEECGGNKVVW